MLALAHTSALAAWLAFGGPAVPRDPPRRVVAESTSSQTLDHDRRDLRVEALAVEVGQIAVDGKLDDEVWNRATPLPPLVQGSPRFGFAATHPTDVKLAYDERGIYVAFDCHDDPDDIQGAFFLRDRETNSDRVFFEIDPTGRGNTGFSFLVNAAGAIADAQIYREVEYERLWDGVWTSGAHVHEHGWSAELFVPWSTLRFDRRQPFQPGINVGRYIASEGEMVQLSMPPQGVVGNLSWYAKLAALKTTPRGLVLEFRPFVSGRFAMRRPEDSLDRTFPALPNAGMDVKYAVTGTLTLDVALNPDFGQAEVDPAVLNLSPFEVQFQEKRQFFLESKELFETTLPLFYSRRIGLTPATSQYTPGTRLVGGEEERGALVGLDPQSRILGSARVTGDAGRGWLVGFITATTAPSFGVEGWSDGRTRPLQVDPTTQWTVARVRKQLDAQSWIGGIITNVTRFGDARDATAGGVDAQVLLRERWTAAGQVVGSHDGNRSGMAANVSLRRRGPNTEARIAGETLTPHVNFRDLGFMRFADYMQVDASASAFNRQPVGGLRRLESRLAVQARADYEGRVTRKLLTNDWTFASLSQWTLRANWGGHLPELDPYETRGNIPWEIPFHWWMGGSVTTPDNRRVFGRIGGAYGEQNRRPGPDLYGSIGFRPVDRLQIDLGSELNASFDRPRWVMESAAGIPIFGRGELMNWATELRATLGILPTLAISSYSQLLVSTARHTAFFELTDPRTLVPTDPRPYMGVVDQGLTSLVSNTILRWEYLPGSFLFVAYTHRTVANRNGMAVDFALDRAFGDLGARMADREDVLFVKLVHYFAT